MMLTLVQPVLEEFCEFLVDDSKPGGVPVG